MSVTTEYLHIFRVVPLTAPVRSLKCNLVPPKQTPSVNLSLVSEETVKTSKQVNINFYRQERDRTDVGKLPLTSKGNVATRTAPAVTWTSPESRGEGPRHRRGLYSLWYRTFLSWINRNFPFYGRTGLNLVRSCPRGLFTIHVKIVKDKWKVSSNTLLVFSCKYSSKVLSTIVTLVYDKT